jgi:hypothetical protein
MNINETIPGATPAQQPDEPLGDRGSEKTWEPPQGEQGISNRPGDEDTPESPNRRSERA